MTMYSYSKLPDPSGVLTKDGGVFTWGDGTYGQLGHNNTSNQLVPRKVFELMGITVRSKEFGDCRSS